MAAEPVRKAQHQTLIAIFEEPAMVGKYKRPEGHAKPLFHGFFFLPPDCPETVNIGCSDYRA
jgi:hypothetical protein